MLSVFVKPPHPLTLQPPAPVQNVDQTHQRESSSYTSSCPVLLDSILTISKGHRWPSDLRLRLSFAAGCAGGARKRRFPQEESQTAPSSSSLFKMRVRALASLLNFHYCISQSVLLSLTSLPFLGCYYLLSSSGHSRVMSPHRYLQGSQPPLP